MKKKPPSLRRRSMRVIMREYWRHAHGTRLLLLVVLVGMLCDGLLQAGMVNFLRVVIDRLVEDPVVFMRSRLLRYTLFGLGAGVVFFPIAYVSHVAGNVFASRMVASFRMALYRHLQKLSMSFYQTYRSGEITSRLTGDVDNGVHALVGVATNGIWSVAMLLTSLASMLLLSAKLTLVFTLLNILYYMVWCAFREQMRHLARAVRDQSGELTAFATEDIAAVSVMKSFASEDRFSERFHAAQHRLYLTQVKSSRINHAFGDLLQVIGRFAAPVCILGAGGLLVAHDGLSIGALVAFWSYWALVQGPLHTLYGAAPVLANCMASMERIMDFMEQTPSPEDKPGARYFQPTQGTIMFHKVTFAYPGHESRPVFQDFSLEVPARTTLGVVGPSGAGKSTLVQLALRFFDPLSGSVLFDGTDLRDVKQASLRRRTGVVLQESFLLAGSIRDNILLGDERATDTMIWMALEQAGAADFVRAGQGGLDAMVGERGVSLSGGQRQRLCIARVFLKNPPLLIFDEATSALDAGTEMQIQTSMQNLLQGRTAIIIAHRLSTLAICDRILMMKDGRVLGLAPHADLLAICPEYADLVALQRFGGAMLGGDFVSDRAAVRIPP